MIGELVKRSLAATDGETLNEVFTFCKWCMSESKNESPQAVIQTFMTDAFPDEVEELEA